MEIWEQPEEQRIAAAQRRWADAWTSVNPERAAQWRRRSLQVMEAHVRQALTREARAA